MNVDTGKWMLSDQSKNKCTCTYMYCMYIMAAYYFILFFLIFVTLSSNYFKFEMNFGKKKQISKTTSPHKWNQKKNISIPSKHY